MAIIDQNALLRCKDENGNEYLLYPITRLDCVDGAEDLLHYGQEQELTASEKAQARTNIGAMVAPDANVLGKGKFLRVSAVDNYGNVTAVEMATSEAYTHPSTHPASMITGLADVATSGKYEDLQDRPFGDIFVVPSANYEFEEDGNIDGLYTRYLPLRDKIIVGESYTVIWDGTVYTCIAKDAAALGFSNTTYLGNSQKILNLGFGDNTGEPFVIALDTNGNVLSACTDDSSESHAISVVPIDNIRKIDSAYLPDGLATEEFVQEKLSGIEVSGGAATETDILPETTLEGFAYGEEFGAFLKDINFGDEFSPFEITLGEEYIVAWDGVEYKVSAQDASSIIAGVLLLGNAAGYGLSGNNEPFAIGVGNAGATFMSATEETSHTVRIYQVGEAPTLPAVTAGDNGKVLTVVNGTWVAAEMNGETFEIEILAEQTLEGFTEGDGQIRLETSAALIAGQLYRVLWDGTEYQPTAYSGDVIDMPSEIICLGNQAVMEWGVAGADGDMPEATEPFVICYNPASVSGAGDILVIMACNEDGSSNTTDDSHTIAIYQIVAADTPDLPIVSSDDNGKFLRVVDGAWAAVTVDSAEEASF